MALEQVTFVAKFIVWRGCCRSLAWPSMTRSVARLAAAMMAGDGLSMLRSSRMAMKGYSTVSSFLPWTVRILPPV